MPGLDPAAALALAAAALAPDAAGEALDAAVLALDGGAIRTGLKKSPMLCLLGAAAVSREEGVFGGGAGADKGSRGRFLGGGGGTAEGLPPVALVRGGAGGGPCSQYLTRVWLAFLRRCC
jgi:hypothetical protein